MAKKPSSKKERIFKLFDQGYRCKDDVVKAIKIRSSTRYTYFSEWKVLRGILEEDIVGVTEPSGAGQERVTASPLPPSPTATEAEQPPESPELYSAGELNAISDAEAKQSPPQEPSPEPAVSASAASASEVEEPAEPEPGTPDDSGNGQGDEEQAAAAETIAPVNTVRERRESKDGKEVKTTLPRHIPSQGLKVTVEVSVVTLALYNIAHAQVKQIDPDAELSMGDFFDHCAERYYSDRGLRLGLIRGGEHGE